MEIKEAISRIEGILDPYPCAPSFSVETCEALEIAIGALKTQLSQEGTTKDATSSTNPSTNSTACTNADAISRQVVIDAIDTIECEIEEGYGFEYLKWRNYFCELPHVDIIVVAD